MNRPTDNILTPWAPVGVKKETRLKLYWVGLAVSCFLYSSATYFNIKHFLPVSVAAKFLPLSYFDLHLWQRAIIFVCEPNKNISISVSLLKDTFRVWVFKPHSGKKASKYGKEQKNLTHSSLIHLTFSDIFLTDNTFSYLIHFVPDFE